MGRSLPNARGMSAFQDVALPMLSRYEPVNKGGHQGQESKWGHRDDGHLDTNPDLATHFFSLVQCWEPAGIAEL